jgi:hypothetical protein
MIGKSLGRSPLAKSKQARALKLLSTGLVVSIAALTAGMVVAVASPTPGVALSSSVSSSASATSSPLSDRAGYSTGNLILTEPNAELTTDLNDMSQAGGTWLRLNFSRANMQPTPTSISWAQTDRVVTAASARGFKIIGVISYSPAWDRPPGTSWQWAPSDPSYFATFAAAVAARYAPQQVNVWEIWNEPNSAEYWAPKPDPVAYAHLLEATSVAIHAVNSKAVVLSGGLSPVATTPSGSDIAPKAFLQAVYQAGAGPFFDGVAIHPYSYPYLPTDTAGGASNGFAQLPAIHDLMVSHGDAQKSVWLTEYGAPTGTSTHAISEARQAQMVQLALGQIRQWPWISVLLWYSPRDKAADPQNPDDNFGLVRYDFSLKPSFAAFRSAVLGSQ